MTKPRLMPIDLAEVTGAKVKNPQRFRQSRGASTSPALGDPPSHFDRPQKLCWNQIKYEMPWLCEADRCITEMCVVLRLKVQAGAHVTTMSQYRSVLREMGATPTSRKRVDAQLPADDDDRKDHGFS